MSVSHIWLTDDENDKLTLATFAAFTFDHHKIVTRSEGNLSRNQRQN